MASDNTITDLTGKLLIAMPDMGDPRFERSVVLICAHSEDGAMGLIVNKSVDEVQFTQVVEQLGVTANADARQTPIHFGGPVETGRGFVLHSDDYDESPSSMKVPGGFCVTATLDVLEALAAGDGPSQALMALGYAGWGPGQLEGELQHNGWLTADASGDLVFSGDNAGKWDAALKSLGVSALHLSATGGSA